MVRWTIFPAMWPFPSADLEAMVCWTVAASREGTGTSSLSRVSSGKTAEGRTCSPHSLLLPHHNRKNKKGGTKKTKRNICCSSVIIRGGESPAFSLWKSVCFQGDSERMDFIPLGEKERSKRRLHSGTLTKRFSSVITKTNPNSRLKYTAKEEHPPVHRLHPQWRKNGFRKSKRSKSLLSKFAFPSFVLSFTQIGTIWNNRPSIPNICCWNEVCTHRLPPLV